MMDWTRSSLECAVCHDVCTRSAFLSSAMSWDYSALQPISPIRWSTTWMMAAPMGSCWQRPTHPDASRSLPITSSPNCRDVAGSAQNIRAQRFGRICSLPEAFSHRRQKIDESQLSAGESAECLSSLLAVERIDMFFIGPGDLSQNVGYPPVPPFGQPRPQAVIDKVGFTVEKIRAAGRIAGTLVTADELPYWLEKGLQFFHIHSDPFLRLGLNGIKRTLGR